ncbi:MAG: 1-deoxy-D-xylulose-5-phosphate synthase [Ignavibacteria bacterium]
MNEENKYQLLFGVDSPADIRNFSSNELKVLCQEVREYLIDVISQTGGHFGGGLGTVELTVALHKVFNTPDDLIVWDTGHQTYPHKVLTGRRDSLKTIRQLHGISGFLKRAESEYDAFGAGHASTSISAALGMASASNLLDTKKKVVAVIGDGAMTGGMAYEAMNNAGVLKSNLIVVFNDNNMSISSNVFQFSNYFTEMIAHPDYNKFKSQVWDFTGKLDHFGDRLRKIASRLENGIKAVITPGVLFEALGFRYFGPVNGHNVVQLVKLLEQVRSFNGPILVHTITQKGKGYKPAEEDVQRLHASTPFDKVTGQAFKKSGVLPSYTRIFGEALTEIVKDNPKVIGITAAMPDGTGLDYLQKAFPKNYFDVGIAEEHAVTFAAGMATQGIIPVVAVYSTFLQRAFDQIIHDVALQKLHVVFVLDRAGLVGADGPTHHGTFDLSYLRMIPGMVIMAPKDEAELRNMLYTAINCNSCPVAIRYPRGNALGVKLNPGFEAVPIGISERLASGSDVAILAVGSMVKNSFGAAEIMAKDGINCEVINMRFIKPLDTKMLDYIASRHNKIITVEENVLAGGFGSAVLEYFASKNYKNDILRLGIGDEFVEHGSQDELYKILELDSAGISKRITGFLNGQAFKENIVA